MAVQPLDKKIIKKRVNQFKRPQSDLFVSVKTNWRRPNTLLWKALFGLSPSIFVPGESGHIMQKFA